LLQVPVMKAFSHDGPVFSPVWVLIQMTSCDPGRPQIPGSDPSMSAIHNVWSSFA